MAKCRLAPARNSRLETIRGCEADTLRGRRPIFAIASPIPKQKEQIMSLADNMFIDNCRRILKEVKAELSTAAE